MVGPQGLPACHLGLLGASKASGPRFQRFNGAHDEDERMKINIKMIVPAVMADQKVMNVILLVGVQKCFYHFLVFYFKIWCKKREHGQC